jgi:hypothetical protein
MKIWVRIWSSGVLGSPRRKRKLHYDTPNSIFLRFGIQVIGKEATDIYSGTLRLYLNIFFWFAPVMVLPLASSDETFRH